MKPVRLYIGNRNYSSWSLRAWLALKRTGAAFEEVVIPLDRPDTARKLRAHSPSARVPVFKHGRRTVWESLAIAEYLAEQFPTARLWPREPAARAVARAVSAEMHAGFVALRARMPMDVRGRYPGIGRTPEVAADIQRIVELWTECRRRFGGGGEFLFGRFTIADAMYAPVVSRFVSYGVTLDGKAAAYRDAVWRWPAMREWVQAAAREPWVIEEPVL
ncbi:MAG: glutathione S-transferase family protein [Gammaproteobacteria bacterium]|nr:glutathione S-transferase family protein [Gammaproteobacteria bacterium]NIR84504.1 glutathione S-transferase family protein [Gammaproteobacteria bacterium]NIR90407.1 glutathione S-transferase family protein [Gammaproteobacteria bacterium]NIU05555.1 glutathione S-transferase family protein [Gammaproteobacteria bacterium]NIV52694.1 glutathione S-transferase [Gammaproteobacteria bacterium]